MDASIKKKFNFFANAVKHRLGDNVRKIILFGSRARGDYWEGSDYDFLVVVSHKDPAVRKAVTNSSMEFLNHYDELAASLLYDETEWQNKKKYPIGMNIEKEGVGL